MAFRRTISRNLFGALTSRTPALTNCRISSPCSAALSAALNPQSAALKSPDPGDDFIFRRYIHRQSSPPANSPELRLLPTGGKLIEKLREMSIGRKRISFDGLKFPAPAPAPEELTAADSVKNLKVPAPAPAPVPEEMTVADAVKILKVSQLETVKTRLGMVEKDCVSYSEFLEICSEECGSFDQGGEYAAMLDQSGCVIVLGNVVFLRPHKVVKAIQGLMSIPSPIDTNDPRMKELEQMEKHMQSIDKEAEFLVRRELWCGLGYLVVQTAAFMRLTFWELSWDVMEPICFYVTSIYFMGGYGFFLRTSKEPSFEGFFQSRFCAKQKKLIKAQNFDVERYNELKSAFCPPQLTEPRESIVSFTSPVDGDAVMR